MDARARAKSASQTKMKGVAAFDAALHSEVVDTYLALSPAAYAEHSTLLLNSPTVTDRLAVSAAIRALGNSELIHYLVPTAVTTARLYYLVAFLEGVVMPQLQVLVSLCEEQGHVGASAKGKKELSSAKTKLSPALAFLAGTGAPALGAASRLVNEIKWANLDRIPQLRNSVAHFRFRLDESVVRARDTSSAHKLGSLEGVGLQAFKALARLLRLPAFDPERVPDYENSSIQYEENLSKPVLPTSRRRSYPEIRQVLDRVERLGLTMLLAFADTGKIHQDEGRLRLGMCGGCNLGIRAGAPGAMVTCPVCSMPWTFDA